MGGRQKDADELLWKVPGVAAAGAVLIPQEPFAAAYSHEMGIKDGAPSTGFVGEHRAFFGAEGQHMYQAHVKAGQIGCGYIRRCLFIVSSQVVQDRCQGLLQLQIK